MQKEPFKIYQGAAPTTPPFVVKLNKSKDPASDPVNFTGIYDIKTCLPNADGTELMLSLVGGQISIVGNPILGKIQIMFTAAQSALLSTAASGTLEIAIVPTLGADPWKVQIPNAYVIIGSEC